MSPAPSPHLRSSASSADNPVSAPRKPSGVPWLGDIPAHWEVKRLKYMAACNQSVLPENCPADTLLRYVEISDVTLEEGIRANTEVAFEEAPSRARRKVKHGDVIISTVRTYLKAMAVVQNPPENLIVSTGFAVFTPSAIDSKFIGYAFKHEGFIGEIIARSTGVSYPAINASEIQCIELPLPPPAEQRAIADFLDARTGQIDRLVERKRTLIERLREKRSALIARCVTRGLTPSVPLRPSGIPWLGDIPAHWEVKQGRYIGTLLGSESPDEANFTDDESASDSVAYAKVDDLNRLSEELELTATKARVIGCKAINGPFILFPKRGAAIFTNKVAIAKMDLLLDPNLMGWRIYPEFYPKFIAYCLISRRLDDLADTSTIPQINNKHIYPASFPAPPLTEQTAIAGHLDRETGKIDRLITRVETAVSRLLEYRSALITAAVTGKITLR